MSRVQHTADGIDALCVDKLSLIGNSRGAPVAVQCALLHPEQVEKIVPISSLTIANSLGIKRRPAERSGPSTTTTARAMA